MVFKPIGSWLGVSVQFFFKRENAMQCISKIFVNDDFKILKRVRSFLCKTCQIFKTINPNFLFYFSPDSQEKTQDQYVENSHLTSVPHWVNNNSLSECFKKFNILHLSVYSKHVTDSTLKTNKKKYQNSYCAWGEHFTSVATAVFPSIV